MWAAELAGRWVTARAAMTVEMSAEMMAVTKDYSAVTRAVPLAASMAGRRVAPSASQCESQR